MSRLRRALTALALMVGLAGASHAQYSIVVTTGAQTIQGTKTFADRMQVMGQANFGSSQQTTIDRFGSAVFGGAAFSVTYGIQAATGAFTGGATFGAAYSVKPATAAVFVNGGISTNGGIEGNTLNVNGDATIDSNLVVKADSEIQGTSPSWIWSDTTGSAEDLEIRVDGNFAQFVEDGDSNGAGFVIDLANERFGFKTDQIPSTAAVMINGGLSVNGTGEFNAVAIPAGGLPNGSVLTADLATTGVAKNTCGSATVSCRFSMDVDGRVTEVSSAAISSGLTAATRQVLTSGSGATYTTAVGATQLRIRMWGGGGGGGGSGGAGGDGGTTIFNSINANGGSGGGGGGGSSTTAGGAGGTGGSGTASFRQAGQSGQNGLFLTADHAPGGGGGGRGAGRGGISTNAAGTAGATNTGGGGGGISGAAGTANGAAGGGEGEYVEILINAPVAATYTFSIGAAGAAGSGSGAAGGSGLIVVDEFYW